MNYGNLIEKNKIKFGNGENVRFRQTFLSTTNRKGFGIFGVLCIVNCYF